MIHDETELLRNRAGLHLALTLDALCHRNRAHKIGSAVKYLLGSALDADGLVLGDGLRWDADGRAATDCKKCAEESRLVPTGTNQQISRARLLKTFDEMAKAGRHTGEIQV